ncbi:DUF1010 domain-containing protein [Acidovorax sp. HDW3]|uniref:DUF1010 domain-containing protein n=1 Tax=Acidovorax sp. HDW3 TaxID=2714923 RepID=UPI001F100FE3|nr:DUF1010 domain-containing protein [Acidovorax sp. HDW3]
MLVSPAEKPLYSAHAFSNGIQFLRRYSAPCWPFLRASPAGSLPISSLLGPGPCAASASSYHFASVPLPRWRCAFAQFAPVVKLGLPVLASGSNFSSQPTGYAVG